VNVQFHPDVYKQLQGLPRTAFAAALRAIIELTRDPRPPGVKKLAGSSADWRLRIGEYRIVYEIDDKAKTVTVMRVAHRRESYR
jgi:mRNA interferase RelE/StbE